MRKQFFVLIAILFIAIEVIAQAPKGIKYQTVVRDAAGALITNQQVNITLSILQGSATGLSVCSETFTPTTNEFGLVNLEIGSVNPTAFAAIDWTNGPYFTKVELNGTEMGTSQLLSVPYALYAENSSNSLWNANGSSLYYNGGKVGIGTDNPTSALTVEGYVTIRSKTVNGKIRMYSDSSITDNYIASYDENGDQIWVLNLADRSQNDRFGLYSKEADSYVFNVRKDGNVGIKNAGSANYALSVNGTTKTNVLEITGGSDLAEPFPIMESLQVGSVVIIDENNPGHLIESTQPYDKRVAGVVSGAGGIKPGLTLKQEGIMEGNQDITLTGRVYVLATAANGAIKPGDRLTTSYIAGHAMRATDINQWDGAVIGKAMTSLEDGEGLVLLLVNLQ